LDNHLEKLLEDIFPSKSLFLATKKDIESLALRVASAPDGLTSVSCPFSVQ